MKFILLILIIIPFSCLYSQEFLPNYIDTSIHSHELIISGDNEYGSNGVKNEMLNKLLFGGEIKETEKNNSFNRLKSNNNTIGLISSNEIQFINSKINLFKNNNLGYSIILQNGLFGSTSFTKDAFGLGFFGNEKYLGQQIDFSGTEYKFISFQKIGFGLYSKKKNSFFHLNYYNINNFSHGQIFQGNYYQNVNSNIDSLKLAGYVGYNDSSIFNKGFGLGIDFDYKLKIEWAENSNAFIQFSLKNIGISQINSGVQYYTFDSTYQYSGFNIHQIMNYENNKLDSNSIFQQLGIKEYRQKTTFFLPGFIQIGKIVSPYYQGKWQSFFGIKLYPTLHYTPLVYLGFQYKLNNYINIGLQESYGGFNLYRTGIYLNSQIKKINFGIGSENVIGLASKTSNGMSLNFRLKWKI